MKNTKKCYVLWKVWDADVKQLIAVYAKQKDAENRARALSQVSNYPYEIEEVMYVKWLKLF